MCPRRAAGKHSANGVKNGVSLISKRPWISITEFRIPPLGDLISISIFGQPVILISSAKVVEDLLEKRSLIYSNRPALIFAGEIVGWSNAIGLLQYGHKFREFRKHMSRLIGTKAAMERFNPLMEHETEKFLVRVLADPSSFSDQIRRWAVQSALSTRLLS
jgi:cytochrome P450